MIERKVLRAHRPPQNPRNTEIPHAVQPKRTVRPPHFDDDEADEEEVYASRRTQVVQRRYDRLPVSQQTRITEEPDQIGVQPLRFLLIALGVILLSFVLAYMIVVLLLPAYNRWNDDRTYGYPRTIHARAMVGHGTKDATYSDFTGENINGYIYVVELPEGDPSQAHPTVYFVTRYMGDGRDLIAVSAISFTDENGDGKLDMLVVMENGSTYVLYNDGKTFSLTAPK